MYILGVLLGVQEIYTLLPLGRYLLSLSPYFEVLMHLHGSCIRAQVAQAQATEVATPMAAAVAMPAAPPVPLRRPVVVNHLPPKFMPCPYPARTAQATWGQLESCCRFRSLPRILAGAADPRDAGRCHQVGAHHGAAASKSPTFSGGAPSASGPSSCTYIKLQSAGSGYGVQREVWLEHVRVLHRPCAPC